MTAGPADTAERRRVAHRKSGADWTPDAVRRLWDWYGSNPHLQGLYFTAMVGRGVVNVLAATGKLSGRVLDYGCGPGHLLAHLLDRGLECHAVDSSPESIRAVNERFAGRGNWRQARLVDGIVTPYPPGHFDVVCCIETLEHLPDDAAAALVSELARVTKPGGIVIVTTPFAENLDQGLVFCPFCDSEFHRWQHFRSYDAADLCALLASRGLEVLLCRSMDFRAFQADDGLPSLRDLSASRLASWLASRARRVLDAVRPAGFPNGRDFRSRLGAGNGPHLCALATRKP